MPASPWRQSACALSAFVLVAVLQSWPLPVHLFTHLTGPPTGDTGVYVWNTWVFRHELVEGRRSPFYTDRIFSLDSRADLSLHNYTVFADVLSVPLQPVLGVVGAFNVDLSAERRARRLRHVPAGATAHGPRRWSRGSQGSRSRARRSWSRGARRTSAWSRPRRCRSSCTGSIARGSRSGGAMPSRPARPLAWAAFCDPYYARLLRDARRGARGTPARGGLAGGRDAAGTSPRPPAGRPRRRHRRAGGRHRRHARRRPAARSRSRRSRSRCARSTRRC